MTKKLFLAGLIIGISGCLSFIDFKINNYGFQWAEASVNYEQNTNQVLGFQTKTFEYQGLVFNTSELIPAERFFDFITVNNCDLYLQKIFYKNKPATQIYFIESRNLRDRDIYYEILTKVQSGDISVNETNDFGQRSFYINDPKRVHMSLLVVQTEQGLFGFEYPKSNHGLIQSVIKKL